MIEINFVSISVAWVLVGCFFTLKYRKKYVEVIEEQNLFGKILLFVYLIPINMMSPLMWIIFKITRITFSCVDVIKEDNER